MFRSFQRTVGASPSIAFCLDELIISSPRLNLVVPIQPKGWTIHCGGSRPALHFLETSESPTTGRSNFHWGRFPEVSPKVCAEDYVNRPRKFRRTGRVARCLFACCNMNYMYRACPSSCEGTLSSSSLIGRIFDGYRILVSVFSRGKRNSPMSTMTCILFPEWLLFVVHVPYHTGGRMMQNT